jgi:hypothetical protein
MREWIDAARQLNEIAAPESKEFWNWFRGSKVVDEHGNPEILFHGTRKQFSGLRANNARHHINHKLLFASNSPEAASEFAGVDRDEEPASDEQWTGGNVHPIYMRMVKPFSYTDLEEMGDRETALSDQISREVLELLGPGRYNNLTNYGDWAILEDDKVLAWLKSKGYDGFVAWEGGGLSYACFDESQVRSVFAFRD